MRTNNKCFTEAQMESFRAFQSYQYVQQHYKTEPERLAESAKVRQWMDEAAARPGGIPFAEIQGIAASVKIPFKELDIFNPDHQHKLLPFIVARNGAEQLKHLSKEDYGRVIAVKAAAIRKLNERDSARASGAANVAIGAETVAGAAGVSSHPVAQGISKIAAAAGAGARLAEHLYSGSEKLADDIVAACPAYWLTADSIAYEGLLTDEAQNRLKLQRAKIEEADKAQTARTDSEIEKRLRLAGLSARSGSSGAGAAARPAADHDGRAESENQSAYRRIVLQYTAEQMMDGVTDAEAIEIYKEFKRSPADADEKTSLAAFNDFSKKLRVRLNVVAKLYQWENLGGAVANFGQGLATITHSRSIAKFSMAVGGVTQAFSGMRQITNAASLISSGGMSVANMAGLMNGATAILGVVGIVQSLCSDDSEDNGLGEALSAIHSAFMGMWTEMRESFGITWEKLDKIKDTLDDMGRDNLQRFGILLAAVNYYGEQSLAHLSYLKKSLHDHMSWMHYDLKSGLQHLMDAEAKRVIREIKLKSKSEDKLKASMETYTSTLIGWLLDAAAKKSGALPISKDGKLAVPDSELVTLLEDRSVFTKLGLLGSLANAHVTDLVDETAFMDSSDWVYVLRVFEFLIKTGATEIAQSKEKDEYIEHLDSIKKRAESVTSLVEKSLQSSNRLFAALLKEYQSALDALGVSLREVVERQRVAMNQSHGLLGDQVWLRLDESAEQSLRRINTERAGRALPMIKPIDWDRVLIEYNPSAPDVTHKIEASYSVALEPFMMSRERMRRLEENRHPLREQLRRLEADAGFNLAHAYGQATVSGRYSMEAYSDSHRHSGDRNNGFTPIFYWTWYIYHMNLVMLCKSTANVLPIAKGQLNISERSPREGGRYDHRNMPLVRYTEPDFFNGHKGFPASPDWPEYPPRDLYETLRLGALLDQNVLAPSRKAVARALEGSELSIQLDRLEAVRLQLVRFVQFLGGDSTELEKQLLGKASFSLLALRLQASGSLADLHSIFDALWLGASDTERNAALLNIQAAIAKAMAKASMVNHPLVLDMLVARNIVDYLQDLIARKAQCDLLQDRLSQLNTFLEKLESLVPRMEALERASMLGADQLRALRLKISEGKEKHRELVAEIAKLGSAAKATVGKEAATPSGTYSKPPKSPSKAVPSSGASASAGIFGVRPATTRTPTGSADDDAWYDDEKVNALLRVYCDGTGVKLLKALPFDRDDAITSELIGARLTEAFTPTTTRYFMPLRIGGNHWIGLLIDRQAGNPLVHWIDPLGNSPAEKARLLIILNATGLFDVRLTQAHIHIQEQRLQDDGYNCGPWVIEILRFILSKGGMPVKADIDIEAKRAEHHQTITTLEAERARPAAGGAGKAFWVGL